MARPRSSTRSVTLSNTLARPNHTARRSSTSSRRTRTPIWAARWAVRKTGAQSFRSACTAGSTSPFALAALVLLAGALRARPRVWQLVALAGLAVLTLHAARGGVWLALYAVPLAATGLGGRTRLERVPRLAATGRAGAARGGLSASRTGRSQPARRAARRAHARGVAASAHRFWPGHAGGAGGHCHLAGARCLGVQSDRRLPPGVGSARLVSGRAACPPAAPPRAPPRVLVRHHGSQAGAGCARCRPPRGCRIRGRCFLRSIAQFPRATCRWAWHEDARAAGERALGAFGAGYRAVRFPTAGNSASLLALDITRSRRCGSTGTPGSASSRGATSWSTAFPTATG